MLAVCVEESPPFSRPGVRTMSFAGANRGRPSSSIFIVSSAVSAVESSAAISVLLGAVPRSLKGGASNKSSSSWSLRC